ncbi:hypothetical protein ACFSKU_19535 [Pontibacter silvestris]|uniref:Lipoprotein n=1 Tax=Pontibacter silvestris TaxID=2305183 RepID=A0ABW4X3J6_9BACT|nr:hypothetical protein [Pontibacter silvestris]MCC9134918.1 hypothetical protein [Pontibacter silvestris]
MKASINILFASLLLTFSCSPKNEEVQDEQVEVGPPAQALDSIVDTRKDGVRTDENDTSPTLPLPQPVLQLLSEEYPNYREPTLTKEVKQHADNHEQGPTLVRGDFNSDNNQDYALQLQQDNNMVVAAAVSDSDSSWTLHELKRDILFNERGTLKTLYYIYLVDEGTQLQSEETSGEIESPRDAVAIGIENNTTTYLYENGQFATYNVED